MKVSMVPDSAKATATAPHNALLETTRYIFHESELTPETSRQTHEICLFCRLLLVYQQLRLLIASAFTSTMLGIGRFFDP